MANKLTTSNADEPPQETNPPPLTPPAPSFFSLPPALIHQILALVPRRYHATLSCVSKNLRGLVRSPEIQRIRSLLGRDSLLCIFINEYEKPTSKWFTLRRVENSPTNNKNQFSAVDIGFPDESEPYASVIAVGSEIFFMKGSSLSIFDTCSRTFRRGYSSGMRQETTVSVGLVGEKIFVIGGNIWRGAEAKSFDLKTQTWKPEKIPEEEGSLWDSAATVSLGSKICAEQLCGEEVVCYDTKDGSCSSLNIPTNAWGWRTGLCAVNNVLYIYCEKLGLMWYNFELKSWRMVTGLDGFYILDTVMSVGISEYCGKLMFLWGWTCDVDSESVEIWCSVIGLERREAVIHGVEEEFRPLGMVPRGYRLYRCLSVWD